MDIRTYFLAFSRLARVQCVTWGHPDTTGIPNMDYFISSNLIEPKEADEHYSEKLQRLNVLPTFYHSINLLILIYILYYHHLFPVQKIYLNFHSLLINITLPLSLCFLNKIGDVRRLLVF